jgi:hypothetical protein
MEVRARARVAVLALVVVVATCTLAETARAFCGFYVSGADAHLYNNATQVVLMRDGTRTVLSMQNNYQGPPEDFAMVVPVPVILSRDNVRTLPKDIFDKMDVLTAPRLVEYWEQDPCYVAVEDDMEGGTGTRAKSEEGAMGLAPGRPAVRIEAKFAVGEYEIVILSADDSGALDAWLRTNGYHIPDGAEPVLRPYVANGSKFFVAKVDTKKVTFEKGMAMLSPLRFHYDSDTFSLPVRLGLLNSNGAQDLIVIILGRNQRYEMQNYPNATIPTNIDVADSVRDSFPAFYAALFDATLAKTPKAIVTEYAWQATSCDPCPTPPLGDEEAAILGADVIPSAQATVKSTVDAAAVRGDAGDAGDGSVPSAEGPPPLRLPPNPPSDFVVTRLHARYSKDSLGDDLVFRAAPPIEGGREDSDPQTIQDAHPSSYNDFQGRYVIRHPWDGPVDCDDPNFGVWGGPDQGGGGAGPSVSPAQGLAFAPRGGVALASLVAGNVHAIDVTGTVDPRRGVPAWRSSKLMRWLHKPWSWAAFGAALGALVVVGLVLISRERPAAKTAKEKSE